MSSQINAAITKSAPVLIKFNLFQKKSVTTESLDALAAFFAQPL